MTYSHATNPDTNMSTSMSSTSHITNHSIPPEPCDVLLVVVVVWVVVVGESMVPTPSPAAI